jgi:hypothetical protein
MAARGVEVDRLRSQVSPREPPGCHQLLTAIANDDIKQLTTLLSSSWILTCINTGATHTPLAAACHKAGDDITMMTMLLNAGADPNRGYFAGPLASESFISSIRS